MMYMIMITVLIVQPISCQLFYDKSDWLTTSESLDLIGCHGVLLSWLTATVS